MSDWVLLGIGGLVVIYKLVDRWLDQREQEPGERPPTSRLPGEGHPCRIPAQRDTDSAAARGMG